MKKVITYGTFDLFHIGHLELLRRAKELGDYLLVFVSTDEFSSRDKNKDCAIPYEERAAIVEAIQYVDEVRPERCWEQKQTDVIEYGADVFVMGDDWEGKFDFLKELCEVRYLSRTEGISTSGIRKKLEG
ncbi:adenylyltransferase/cytidyltransferase family protein [Rubritalea spongiae]|uniref:Adenylyltransferase/cytidyltransferase family protein n=1 Tax=Rubritalea spongiae TaxID=430797 RepID=A0ABW5E0W3_9BACT